MKSLIISDSATVRGILNKTITEWWEPMKQQPVDENDIRILSDSYDLCSDNYGNTWGLTAVDHNYKKTRISFPFKNYNSDFEKPRLLLRERWFPVSPNTRNRRGKFYYSGRLYEVDGLQEYYPCFLTYRRTGEKAMWWPKPYPYTGKNFRWRPAHTMPEWASRCVVKVEGVQIKRVQDLSQSELWATAGECPKQGSSCKCAQHRFEDRWNAVFQEYPYKDNPWAWGIRFRRAA